MRLIFLNLKDQEKKSSLIGITLVILLFFAWQLALRAVDFLFKDSLSESVLFILSRLLFCLYFFLLWLYTIKVEKQPFLLWKEKSQPFSFYLFQPAVLLILVIAGSGIITYLLSFFGINQVSSSIKELHQSSWLARLLGIMVAAIFEELIFRAYLIPRLQLFFKSIYPPVLIAALLFGLGHAGYGTFSNVFVPLFAGLVYGFHYQRYRSIKVLIIFHFLFDYLALLT